MTATTIRIAEYALLLGALYFAVRYFEWGNLYHPRRALDATPESEGLAYEDVNFVAEDGVALHGWWIPQAGARGTVIYFHGNGENIGDLPWIGAELHRHRVNAFLVDYRGYGRSRGIPTEQGTYRDARAAYEYVRAQYDHAENPPVIAWGHSLGAAVAVQLACDKPLRGLVLTSAFASTLEMGRVLFPKLPLGAIVRYRYDSLSKMPGLTVPKLIAHSAQDDVVPYAQGRALFAASAEPKTFVSLHGGHNEPQLESSAELREAVGAFFDRVLGAGPIP